MSTSQIHVSVFLSSVFVLFGLLSVCTNATENITLGQFVTDGQTIISVGKKFELGFFSPGNSSNRYVGIWFYKIPIRTVVWVANRENPILDRTGVLNITDDGNLVVMDGDGKLVWSTNVSIVASNSTAAVLMDNGNLKLRSGDNSNKDLWQSFNDPTDTFLPGMKMGYNSETGENNIFTSWKSADDPSKGNYHMGVDLQRTPQILIWEGFKPSWRSGEWDGQTFVGVPHMRYLYLFGFKLISGTKKGEMYFTYTVPNDSDILRYWIGWDGRMKKLRWDEERKEWILTRSEPTDDECGIYNRCGAFGRCSQLDSPICSCFHGYEPKDSQQWSKGNWSGGCGRRTELQCEKNSSEIEDGFTRLEGIKLPDFSKWVTGNGSNGRIECEDECLRNCSCNAYAYVRGIGCLIWSVDLVDVQQFQEGGKTIYIRLAGSELLGVNSGISKQIIVIIAISVVVLLSISIYSLWRFIPKPRDLWRKRNEKLLLFVSSKNWEFSAKFSGPNDFIKDGQQGNVPELPLFNFDCVAVATRNFSEENKLGQGGFGPVYKGMLPGGQEVAVKRLSRSSIQGLEEFMNEIILIAKLQHRNLVRLLGCCIRGEEKMLLYEYMPNGSLDSFIFDPAKQGQLYWRKRFRIIEGIARGLLYLHRDSRLRIIHRDLKASNILLDNEMNPKISDFGMAKIFGGNQNHANTDRVVGTYGYMSPEYAMKGLVSVKTDVYSFGVSLLEIVSGKRNSYISHSEHNSNLIGYAWHLWSEGKGKEFMDSSIVDTCLYWEVLRCIHVGLLCVQDSAMERPTMSSVLLMLESETANVPNPKQPTFSVV